jgi:AcrR family transcriptional regulator
LTSRQRSPIPVEAFDFWSRRLPTRRAVQPQDASRDARPRSAAETVPRKAVARGGRPTVERAAAIEQAILDVARRLFLDNGYDATSMEAVAAAAGVSKGTLYARYPTKSVLIRAVVKQQTDAWTATYVRNEPLPQDFKQRLQHFARGTLAALMDPECRPYRRLAHHAAIGDREFTSALYELALTPAIADLSAEIARGAADFPAPLRNPERVARMFLAMLYGWWAEREAAGGATQDEANAYADHAVDVLFYGRAAW